MNAFKMEYATKLEKSRSCNYISTGRDQIDYHKLLGFMY